MYKSIWAVIFLFISGCVSFSNLSPSGNYADIKNDSIIVLGVHPKYRLHIFKGENAGNKWLRDTSSVTLNTYPEKGYIVAKLPNRVGGKSYGIGGILPSGIGGELFFPCEGSNTMVFDAPPGSVVYIGDIVLNADESSYKYEVSMDFTSAKQHIKTMYPLLADRLTSQNPMQKELANISCEIQPASAPDIPLIFITGY
ncbi:hypothetical protein [Pseudoalteromonas sp. T1lg75]|uniref:hypothetical protein n=1 Tax=Pseudoalteromonas sp. T1lg75 TaxID=2077102 RepID=UPI000CF6347F|nr:hypothetical protein [Pseudoalteromonas sp. T1lg75]